MKVHKGTRLTNKYDPYYIALGNTYSLPEDFSANLSQTNQPTNIDSQFKISAAVRRHKKKNDKINKYIIKNKDNDEVLIHAVIKLAEDERNIIKNIK